MATNTLTDQNIADTYTGVLHANGEQIPPTSQAIIYDGYGSATALSLGLATYGITISGNIVADGVEVNGIHFPETDGSSGQFLKTDGAGNLTFDSIAGGSLPTLSPNPSGTYTGIASITVNSNGLVTSVTTGGGGITDPSSSASISLYATPILIYNNTGVNNDTASVSGSQTNKPDDATHAIIQISQDVTHRYSNSAVWYTTVAINGWIASKLGSTFDGEVYRHSETDLTTWYAKLDGSSNFTVSVQKLIGGADNDRAYACNIYLLGYATLTTLSNP